jgi:ribosomal-protein-alanine N-acetyltransferase
MAAEPSGLAEGLHLELLPMRRRHLRQVLKIEAQVYPKPWTLGLFLSELGLKTRIYLVAKVGQTVVGYAGLMLSVGDGHVTTIAVDPAWQRNHIGARMLLALSRAGIASGCTALTLEVRMSNHGAQAMYRRFGYAPAGIRKNYYAEVNEDALVMWAHDVDLEPYAQRLADIEAGLPGSVTIDGGIPA